MADDWKLMSLEAAADKCGCCVKTIRAAINSGELVAKRLGKSAIRALRK